MTQEQITTFLATISHEEVDGKCVQVQRNTVDGVDYRIDEYVTSNGDAGCQVIIYKTEDDVDYSYSQGYGVEADARTHDWEEIIID